MLKAFSIIAIVSIACCATSFAQAPTRPPVLRGVNPSRTSSESNAPVPRTENNDARVSSNLITVPAVVMDRNGRYIGNLRKEDFRVFEEGVEQNVTYFASIEKPFTVALLLDVSGSTQFQLAQIREAANTFVGRLRMNDRLMAIAFDGKISVLTEPERVSVIRRGKLHISAVTDGTVLYDTVDFALKRMAQIPGRKAIVLMTDGVDQGSRVSMQETLAHIAEQDVLVYTVQYNTLPQLPERLRVIKDEKARRRVRERLLKGYAVSEPYLRTLAEKTGGRFYRADDLRQVGPAFEAITSELGVQYSLGYSTSSSRANAEHTIRVKVRYPNMVVRTRDSFSTAAVAQKD